jgi:predicted trehalose synthase
LPQLPLLSLARQSASFFTVKKHCAFVVKLWLAWIKEKDITQRTKQSNQLEQPGALGAIVQTEKLGPSMGSQHSTLAHDAAFKT